MGEVCSAVRPLRQAVGERAGGVCSRAAPRAWWPRARPRAPWMATRVSHPAMGRRDRRGGHGPRYRGLVDHSRAIFQDLPKDPLKDFLQDRSREVSQDRSRDSLKDEDLGFGFY